MVVLRESIHLSLDAPLLPLPTGKVADNPSFTSVSFGRERRTDPPPATAGAWRYPRLPATPACLRLASPTPTTRSYKSTETQRAAHWNAGTNRYPDFYRISRFDIRINEKFDINITSLSPLTIGCRALVLTHLSYLPISDKFSRKIFKHWWKCTISWLCSDFCLNCPYIFASVLA